MLRPHCTGEGGGVFFCPPLLCHQPENDAALPSRVFLFVVRPRLSRSTDDTVDTAVRVSHQTLFESERFCSSADAIIGGLDWHRPSKTGPLSNV